MKTKWTEWAKERYAEAAILKEKWYNAPSGTGECKAAEIEYYDALAKIRGAYEFVEWLEGL